MRAWLFVLLLAVTGCSSVDTTRTASELVAKGHLASEDIRAGQFTLRTWGRIAMPGTPLIVYIEGDGFAWETRYRPSSDPTPHDPVALKLAALDPSANVVYIARPCQYVRAQDPKCDVRYWTSHRFAPEVVAAVSYAVDQWKRRARAETVQLVGHSGGGAVAILVAAERSDVATIRSVAGNLDHVALNRIHGVDQLTGSLNAADVAGRLARVPQIHFIGTDDEVVTREVTDSYLRRVPDRACVAVRAVKATHQSGWEEQWPTLLATPLPRC